MESNANKAPVFQLCYVCGDKTDRCEEDSLYVGVYGPLCEFCYDRAMNEIEDRR